MISAVLGVLQSKVTSVGKANKKGVIFVGRVDKVAVLRSEEC